MSRIYLLLKAIVLLAPSMAFLWGNHPLEWADEHGVLGFVVVLATLCGFFFGFVSAIAFIQTFFSGWQTPAYDSAPLRNIDALRSYRETKLGAMPLEEAARLLNGTRTLDLNGYDPNSNTGETMRFLNAKLGALSNEDGIEYLKGNRK